MEARVIVAVDFGTTFTGFAYAHSLQPEEVFTNYNWPLEAQCSGVPYCKTLTALYYSATRHNRLISWGWPALQCFMEDCHVARQASHLSRHNYIHHFLHKFDYKRLFDSKHNNTETNIVVLEKKDCDIGQFLWKFKLLLAPKHVSNAAYPNSNRLPAGLTTQQVISDYLQAMGDFILEHLKKRYGNHMCKGDIQWCVTIPAIWDDESKQQMKHCMEVAELVGPSPPILVLEPEAAAMYAYKMEGLLDIQQGDKLLVVDIGGGTTDIVVHERVNRTGALEVREVIPSSGIVCGGIDTDGNFLTLLHYKIGCLKEFLMQHPSMLYTLLQWWERTKCGFDGMCSATLDLPSKLARAWQDYNACKGQVSNINSYDEIEFSVVDMLKCFDPVVDKILDLISTQMAQCQEEVKVIMVVGGFSGSPYLMKRIHTCFASRVQKIVNPPNPGSAVCQGAVMLSIHKKTIKSRILKKTYGIEVLMGFKEGDPITYKYVNSQGHIFCKNQFDTLALQGAEMNIDACITKVYIARCRDEY